VNPTAGSNDQTLYPGEGDATLDVLDGSADEWWSRHLPGNAFA